MTGLRRRDRISSALIAAALLAAVFLIGGTTRWTAWVSSVFALAATIPFALSRRSLAGIPLLLMFIGASIAACALQVVPLPISLIELLSPARATLAIENSAALAIPRPNWIPMSFDPANTLRVGAQYCGYFALAVAGLRLVAHRNGRRLLMTLVSATSFAVALVAIGHHLLGAERLFGIYTPAQVKTEFLAPLMGPNQLAALLLLAVPVSFGLALSSTGFRRIAHILMGLVTTGMCILTESRGGNIALGLSMVVFIALVVARSRRNGEVRSNRRRTSNIVAGIVVGLCVATLLGIFTARGLVTEFAETNSAQLASSGYKFSAWKSATELIRQAPITGVGRGAFQHAFTRVQPTGLSTFSHLENEYLQAAVEWGIPISAGLMVLGILLAAQVMRRWQMDTAAIGALSGLAALLVHSFADFALSFPGVAVPALLLLCSVLPAPELRIGRRKQRILRSCAIVLAIVLVGLAASPLGRTADEDVRVLAADVADKAPTKVRVSQEMTQIVARHPSDYLPWAIAANSLFRSKDKRAIEFVNRALSLNPRSAALHRLAARMLVSAGHQQQAALEFRLALENSAAIKPTLRELLRVLPDVQVAARALPTDARRIEQYVVALQQQSHEDLALVYARNIASRYPHNYEVNLLVARIAEQQGEHALAIRFAKQVHQARPSLASAVALARALRGAERRRDALRTLTMALSQFTSSSTPRQVRSARLLRADLAFELGDFADAREELEELLARALSDSKFATRAHRRLSRVERKLGNQNRATWHDEQAKALSQSNLLK